MKIKIGKIKSIACRTKSGKKRLDVQIGNEKIEKISEFCYLESKMTNDVCCNGDAREFNKTI